jgi:hypothetical protein
MTIKYELRGEECRYIHLDGTLDMSQISSGLLCFASACYDGFAVDLFEIENNVEKLIARCNPKGLSNE